MISREDSAAWGTFTHIQIYSMLTCFNAARMSSRMPSSLRAGGRARLTTVQSSNDNVGSTVDWYDVGRRRCTLRVDGVRTSKSLLLASLFVAVLLDQLMWTTIGMT